MLNLGSDQHTRHLARLEECRWRRDTPGYGSCAQINKAIGSVVSLGMEACDECWSKGAETDAGGAVRNRVVNSVVLHIKGKPLNVPPKMAAAVAMKFCTPDEQRAILSRVALTDEPTAMATAEVIGADMVNIIRHVVTNATVEDRAAAKRVGCCGGGCGGCDDKGK